MLTLELNFILMLDCMFTFPSMALTTQLFVGLGASAVDSKLYTLGTILFFILMSVVPFGV